jgi:hypothetical protein
MSGEYFVDFCHPFQATVFLLLNALRHASRHKTFLNQSTSEIIQKHYVQRQAVKVLRSHTENQRKIPRLSANNPYESRVCRLQGDALYLYRM